jgi:cation:H+ antiporter
MRHRRVGARRDRRARDLAGDVTCRAGVIWVQFIGAASLIVLAGSQLARYGDIIGEKTGLGGSWVGMVLLAATTSLPELFTGIGAAGLAERPDIAVGDVVGSCMFNLLILSAMDAIQPEPLSARAHQSHALSIGLGIVLAGIAGIGFAAADLLPSFANVSLTSLMLIALYFLGMRAIYRHERDIRLKETREIAAELRYGQTPLRTALVRYALAAAVVVAAALWLPHLAGELARQTGLGEAFVGSLFVAITTSLPEVVVSISAVRIGAIDLGVGNLLGSNLFNFMILGLDDVFYRAAPLSAAVEGPHGIGILAVVVMSALFLVGLTYRVLTKRFAVAWDTGSMAVVYIATIALTYLATRA